MSVQHPSIIQIFPPRLRRRGPSARLSHDPVSLSRLPDGACSWWGRGREQVLALADLPAFVRRAGAGAHRVHVGQRRTVSIQLLGTAGVRFDARHDLRLTHQLSAGPQPWNGRASSSGTTPPTGTISQRRRARPPRSSPPTTPPSTCAPTSRRPASSLRSSLPRGCAPRPAAGCGVRRCARGGRDDPRRGAVAHRPPRTFADRPSRPPPLRDARPRLLTSWWPRCATPSAPPASTPSPAQT